jgi:2-polyprenyl-3-methyl-5-hydroxy-6-metoxy-1,4-benzoquinol methylase
MERRAYWDNVYRTRPTDRVGWYEADPAMSRRFIAEAIGRGAKSIIDVGGGASALVDHLLGLDLDRIAVLDISETGLEIARRRLGDGGARVEWMAEDITQIGDVSQFDIWHDRAVFHFLVDPEDRERYVRVAERTVSAGGVAIMATFAPDGPDHCSGLEVCRYDPSELAAQCGPSFELLRAERHIHTTPGGVAQSFVYSEFRHAA